MKKAQLSPVASIAVSFSLALGILVSDLAGLRSLNAAHAHNGSQKKSVQISEGVALNGIAVRGLVVNGEVVSHGVIAGSVRIVDGTVLNPREVNGDGTLSTSGVIVGDQKTKPSAANSGDSDEETIVSVTGVIVGDQKADTTTPPSSVPGVIVGDTKSAPATVGALSGVIILGGKADGGELVGDDITVNDGVITGRNLLLTGASIKGGSVYGGGSTVQISPAN